MSNHKPFSNKVLFSRDNYFSGDNVALFGCDNQGYSSTSTDMHSLHKRSCYADTVFDERSYIASKNVPRISAYNQL